MMTEKFSVSICVYGKDNSQWFRTAVDSILNQTAKPDEVVLVVDGPVPPELDAVIGGYERLDRFKVIRLPENRGLGNARRVGLAHCSNELVAMMDADDISVPERFEKQLAAFAQDGELSIVGGQIAEFVHDVDAPVGIRTVPLTDAEIRRDIKTRCPFNHMTVMVKKSDVDRAGGYQDWFWNEDYFLWLRMHLAGMRSANVPEVLVNVRVGEDMYMRRGGRKYFFSELGLQNYMLRHRIIGVPTYLMNVAKRIVVQLLLPNRVRGWVYKKFARKQDV